MFITSEQEPPQDTTTQDSRNRARLVVCVCWGGVGEGEQNLLLIKIVCLFIMPNEKNKCVSDNLFEDFRQGSQTIFFKYKFMHFESY